MRSRVPLTCVLLAVAVGLVFGCGEDANLFNPSFVNFAIGGVMPLVPLRESEFVLVTVINTTSSPLATTIKFVVTAERQIEVVDDDGVVTIQTETETVNIQTAPQDLANQVGVLFDCPVARVGLGENIDFPATEPGLFLDAVTGGAEGFGVPGNVNPLSMEAGNFACGDTIIFQASSLAGAVGGVGVTTFVLDADEQPTEYSGPNTFVNARTVLEEFRFEE